MGLKDFYEVVWRFYFLALTGWFYFLMAYFTYRVVKGLSERWWGK